jgi:hypothetical protein
VYITGDPLGITYSFLQIIFHTLKKIDVPIKDRYLLTYYEAAAYFGIGINRLREICKDPACSFVITTGEKKTMVIRTKLEEYIAEHRYI